MKIFKKKYAKANNLKDYKSLPENEREIFGFWYLQPESYLLGGGDFDEYWAKKYPVQYRIREFFIDCSIKWSIFKMNWHDKVVCRLNPRNQWARKVIPRTYTDKDVIIEDIIIAAVIDFVENEVNRETFMSEENKHLHKVWEEITDIYTFFKVDLEKMQLAHECVMDKWIKSVTPHDQEEKSGRSLINSIFVERTKSPKSDHLFLKSQIMQAEMDDQISSYLKRLIEVRRHLWS